MPTFYACKTTIQLSVADITRATTPNPRSVQCPEASQNIRSTAQEFARGSKDGTLTETPLLTEDGSHIRFLGKHQDMPFFMVHAGKTFFELDASEKRNRRPARVPLGGPAPATPTQGNGTNTGIDVSNKDSPASEPDRQYKPPSIPHALCLTVFLSRSSFVRSVDERTKKLEINDVKLDAYFNGQLCGSHYVPRRYSGENYFMEEQIVRFTGRRIARLLEKPWTIAPSAQNPDGSLRYSHSDQEAYAYAGAKERWDAISRSLMAEADEIGRDEKGERPVIGEYLETLAALPMPAEVEDMQKPGGPKFGVLDVVVTWGKGNKDPPDYAYLVKPTPIRIDGCRSITTESIDLVPFEDLAAEVDNPKPQPTVQAEDLKVPISTSISGEDTLKPVSDIVHDFTTTAPPSATTPILPHEPPDPPPPTTKTTTVRPPKRPDPPTSPLPIETPIKRSRGPYYDVLTTRQTLSEEFALVESQAIGSPSAYLPRTRRRRSTTGLSSTAASSPLSSPPQSRQTTPAVGNLGTVEVTEPIQLGGSSRSSASVGRQMVKDGAENVGHHSPPLPRRTPVPAARRRDRTSTQPSAEMLGRAFTTPALSEDCVVTYTGKGIVRNIGAVRSGRFSERGVVMGTRFLVG